MILHERIRCILAWWEEAREVTFDSIESSWPAFLCMSELPTLTTLYREQA